MNYLHGTKAAESNIMRHFLLYIDPGSGSYLVQAIIAAVLGGLFYFKQKWLRIKSWFGRKREEPKTDNPEQHDGH
jgi:hypothetical protein